MSKALTFPNETTRLLSGFIFNKETMPLLKSFGLISAFVDDYGYRSKYTDCLFFLFKTDAKYFSEFEKKIVNFQSFYDWYDISEDKRMYIFRVNSIYQKDLSNFKGNNLEEMSEYFYELQPSPLILNKLDINLSKEIYRFEGVNRNKS